MLKFMYLAKRKPGFTPEDFRLRWRQHGALAMTLPLWRNMALYIQADTIRPVPIAGASGEYDGFSYAVARDERAFKNPSPQEIADVKRLADDELETFEGPIPPIMMFVDDQVLKKGGPGGVTACLAFKDFEAAASVAKSYANKPTASRVVLNRVREDMIMPGSNVPYRGTVEISAGDLEGLKNVLASDNGWRAAAVAIVAAETILDDKLSEKAA
jgi:hypothetical protein